MHRRISTICILTFLALLLPLRLAAFTKVYPVEAINDLWLLHAAEFDEKYPGIEITGGLSLSDEGWYVRYRHENLTYFFGPIVEQETARLRMWDLEAVRDEAIRYEPALLTSQVDYVRFTYTGVYGRRGDGSQEGMGGNGAEPVREIGGMDGTGNGGQDSEENGTGGGGSGTEIAGMNGGTGNQSGQSGSQGGNQSGRNSGQNGSLFPGVGDSEQNQSGFPTGNQSGTAMSSGGIGLPQPNAGGQGGSATGSQSSNSASGSSSGTPGSTSSGSSSGQPPPNDFLSALLRAILGL